MDSEVNDIVKGFVHATDQSRASLGIGKVWEATCTETTVAWFDSPLTEPHVEQVSTKSLKLVTLEPQTRVYWLDRSDDVWRVGRVLDADDIRATVRFANKVDRVLPVSELEVRWSRPVDDPSAFLAAKINESPLFAQARTGFARSLIDQRGASSGMSALISSVIDLEQHQYEVVKRVLKDPVQRYLLADEVGLGKTVEAGVLIRQYVLDRPHDHKALVIAPPTLVVQWRRELRKRFLLGHLLDDSLTVMSMGADPTQLLEALGGSGMVVIDEAHHLSHDPDLYALLSAAIITVPRVLLLSATPALHNERGFLGMLHLLDPHTFRLDEEVEFRQRIEHRQALAESVAGLVPENLLRIEDFIDDVVQRFPDDKLLQEHADSLRELAYEFPDESDPKFLHALGTLRAHLTETYRLDRRILRNRRRDLPFLTPHRAGVERITFSSPHTAQLIQALEAWRTAAAEAVYGNDESEYACSLGKWFRALLDGLATDVEQVNRLARERKEVLASRPPNFQWENEFLVKVQAAAEECMFDMERFDALQNLVERELQGNTKVVVFCSQSTCADAAAAFLGNALSTPIDRYIPHDDPEDDDVEQRWELFLSEPSHRVLVCDGLAEEGLNLQGGAKTVIHFDLPLAPNRIEQRLGRADRYGSGDAIRSIALCCSDDPYAVAWETYLDQGLGVFSRSVASLQYLIEDDVQRLTNPLLLEGVGAIRSLTERTTGEHGSAERELRHIEDQDGLDALSLPDEGGQFEALEDIDGDWRRIAAGVREWMVDILQIDHEPLPSGNSTEFGFDPFRFCFSYRDHGGNTLIPLKQIFSTLLGSLDLEARGANSRLLKTGWYTCRRATAIGTSVPPEGIRLVRWGEALVDRIQQITGLDDRGRAAAMWRRCAGYNLQAETPADVFVRLDFIVEADISRALSQLDEAADPALGKALQRRGDMALAPFYKTLWIDEQMSVVKDPRVLELLNRPYRRAPTDGTHQDWNLNSERWSLVESLGLPVMASWREWVPRARAAAEQLLRSGTDLERLCQESVDVARVADERRFAQLRARIRYGETASATTSTALLNHEAQISNALYAALQEPRITLGTIVAVFVSPYGLPQLVLTRG